MKNIFILLVLAAPALHAQNASLLSAERAFAHQAQDSGIRRSFINNLDTNSVIFSKGQASSGMRMYSAMKETSMKLYWEPARAAVSTSNDLGFTTGPFEVRDSSGANLLSAGAYSTVWRRNSRGEWKALVDIGATHKGSLFGPRQSDTIAGLVPAATADYEKLEQDFIRTYRTRGAAAFEHYAVKGSTINLQGHQPITTKAALHKALTALNLFDFDPLGGGVSQAKDLAYAFGNVKQGKKKGNYLRVWGHIAKGWVILLQVVNEE